MIRKISSTAAALLLIASLCAWQQPNKRYEATFLSLFDTVTTVVGYAPSRGDFTAQAQFIHDELEQYHRLYDIYHSYEGLSNLKTINDKAGREPVVVDHKIISMLQMAKKLALETDGRFHPVFGSVTSLWHDYREAGIDDPEQAALPPMPLLQQAALHTALDRLVIDEAASTVYLADPAMRLDVGAIAKGYAVEQVSRAARANGFSSGLISVGGNVCAIG
ncbi:MAG: FAD:protein FMN transferase, partial [Oscillospiraceae bacterium]